MSDYINYIDFNAIKLADLASEIGDYKCAVQNYSKALNRLRNYQGDRMQPIMMASDLVKKLEKLKQRTESGKSLFKFATWSLTKSSYVKGSQCVKYLFLDKFKKQEKTPISEEKRNLFDKGHSFENKVREVEFPNGINIKDKVGNFAYFNSYTEYLLNIKGKQVLYEATIIENKILVMCDVLIKNIDDTIDVYEIKLNKELNEAILNDLSIQYWICKKRFGDRLTSFKVILSSQNEEKWTIRNLKNELAERQRETKNRIDEFFQILKGKEPSIKMGAQCNKPYECEFIDYCKNKC
jgi:tetratricopeptide (TPR) repeat protein